MKRYIILLLCLHSFVLAFSQNKLEATDDIGRIALTPIIAENSAVPQYAQSILKNKLKQIVSQNGIGGTALNKRFVITANIQVLGQETIPTAPPMIAVHLVPTLYIGDINSGVLFASYSFDEVRGVGTTEDKAYIAAIKTLKTTDAGISDFIESGKAKIIEFYNSQIDFLLNEAQALADQNNYDESIKLLMSVPTVCKDAYLSAMNMVSTVFQKKIDTEGASLLNQARQVWNSNSTYEGAEKAAHYLSQIHPLSSSINEASKMSNSIAKKLKEDDEREWNFAVKKHDDKIALEKQKIDAAKEVAIAQAHSTTAQPTVTHWW